jgi:hypothetical protein
MKTFIDSALSFLAQSNLLRRFSISEDSKLRRLPYSGKFSVTFITSLIYDFKYSIDFLCLQ